MPNYLIMNDLYFHSCHIKNKQLKVLTYMNFSPLFKKLTLCQFGSIFAKDKPLSLGGRVGLGQ